MAQQDEFSEGKRLVEAYYSAAGVDRWTEKVLVEICASHRETNESSSSIARRLGVSRSLVKGVLVGEAEHEGRNQAIAQAGNVHVLPINSL